MSVSIGELYVIIPKRTRGMVFLNENRIGLDQALEQIRSERGILNEFANEIRYPYRIEIKEEDVVRNIDKI
jgi:hypothetical protein